MSDAEIRPPAEIIKHFNEISARNLNLMKNVGKPA